MIKKVVLESELTDARLEVSLDENLIRLETKQKHRQPIVVYLSREELDDVISFVLNESVIRSV